MIVISCQLFFGFLTIIFIVLQNKGFNLPPSIVVLSYLLMQLTVILFLTISKKINIKKALFQLGILRVVSTLSIQISYVSSVPNNNDILMQKPVISWLLENNFISYNLLDYNNTNSLVYAQYPVTEILISTIHFITGIEVNFIQKYLAVFLSPLLVYPAYLIFRRIFKEKRTVFIGLYVFLQTPWLIFFHSHIVHETLAFIFVLFFLSLNFNTEKKKFLSKRTIIQTCLAACIVFTHHFSSLILVSILLIHIIVLIAQTMLTKEISDKNDVKTTLYHSIYYFLFTVILVLIWGLRAENTYFYLIMEKASLMLQSIDWFYYAIFSFIVVIVSLLYYWYNKKSESEKMKKFKKNAKLFLKRYSRIIAIFFSVSIISSAFLLVYFDLIPTTGILPNGYYYVIALFFAIIFSTFIFGIAFLLWNRDFTQKKSSKNTFLVLSICFAFLLVVTYLLINWNVEFLQNFNVRERIQVFTFFFISAYIGVFFTYILSQKIKISKINISKVISCVLLLLISCGSMFYSFDANRISNTETITNADDKRLYPLEWEYTALYFRENNETYDGKTIISTYRGKIFIEGIATLQVFDHYLLQMIDTFRDTGNITLNTNQVFVLHSAMLILPIHNTGKILSQELFEFIVAKSLKVFSTENIWVYHILGGL